MNPCISASLVSKLSEPNQSKSAISSFVIRTAQSQDIKGLAEVLTQSFHPPVGFLWWTYPLLKLGIYEDLRSRLRSSSPYFACVVASIPVTSDIEQEEVVGTVEIALRSSTWLTAQRLSRGASKSAQSLYISNLAVKSAYRRQGIAQKLLLRCEQIALEWGFQEIFLHVLENNDRARRLYSKSGYRLHQIDSNLGDLLLKRPRRLLLHKSISKLPQDSHQS